MARPVLTINFLNNIKNNDFEIVSNENEKNEIKKNKQQAITKNNVIFLINSIRKIIIKSNFFKFFKKLAK